MIWSTLLVAALAAGPRAHPEAEWALYVPKVANVSTLVPFFTRAGERSVLLRSASWREDVHPLLSIDLGRPEDFTRAGIDLNGSVTVSARDYHTFTCVQLDAPERYEKLCQQRLATLGKPFREVGKDGVVRAGAKDTLERVLAGYVLKGRESCAIRGKGRNVDAKFDEAAKLMGKNSASPMFKLGEGLPGPAVLVSKQGALALRGGELSLTLEGKTRGFLTDGLLGSGPSPFAFSNPDGLSVFKFRGDRKKLDGATDTVVRTLMQVCLACEKPLLDEVVRGLLPQLGGNALAYLREVQVKGSLRSMGGRYFSVKNVLVADVLDEKAARAAIAPLGKVMGVKPLANGEGWTVAMRDGEIRFGVRGKFLYVGNDDKTIETALRSAAKGEGTQTHGMEMRLDPRKLARALAQIPLLEAIGNQELQGLVVVAGELGPLLLSSERIYGWGDPTGADTTRGRLEWTLLPPPVADGGVPDGGWPDGGMPDGGWGDGGEPDGGWPDGGAPDGGR